MHNFLSVILASEIGKITSKYSAIVQFFQSSEGIVKWSGPSFELNVYSNVGLVSSNVRLACCKISTKQPKC